MSDKEVLIQVENLEKSFGDHQVIKGISTTISRGDVVAVIGPSGCGKSTFLRSMNVWRSRRQAVSHLRERTLPMRTWISIWSGKRSAWYFSSLTCFPI